MQIEKSNPGALESGAEIRARNPRSPTGVIQIPCLTNLTFLADAPDSSNILTTVNNSVNFSEISNDEEWSTKSESDCSDNSRQCDGECESDRREVIFPGRAAPKAAHLKHRSHFSTT